MASAFFGFDIAPPIAEGKLWGLAGTNIMQARDFDALAAAYRLKLLDRQFLRSHDVIAEIGSGIGKVLYYLTKLGCKKIYSFDLPYVQSLAAFNILRFLPQEKVALCGENESDAKLVFKAADEFHKSGASSFDITFNQDSMPEMGASIVTSYLESICNNTKHFFVSVNHESKPPGLAKGSVQNRVAELTRTQPKLNLISRNIFPLRRGYMEEIYRVG